MGGGGRRDGGSSGGDGESPAVAAVVGGILAREVLRSVTGKGEPVRNSFFFGVRNGRGRWRIWGARRERFRASDSQCD